MPQSPELAAGAGFTFENLVAARFLAALLTEHAMPGAGGVVTGVALQQRDFGQPLDDVIIDVQTVSGALARLSLQCKSSIVISSAARNADFREAIRDSVMTLQNADFRNDQDRFGIAVRSVAVGTFDTLTTLCELARNSDTFEHFERRFLPGGNASAQQKDMKNVIRDLLTENLGVDFSEAFLYRFLRHFVIIRFDYLHEGAVDSPDAINAVRPAMHDSDGGMAGALWAVLCEIARESAGRSAQFSRRGLVIRIDRSFPLAGAKSLKADLAKLSSLASDWVRDIDDDVRGARLSRDTLAAQLSEVLMRERFIQVRGLAGSGKSVLLRRRIEADLRRGPVLFLKSDRLEGKSWASFARAVGLSEVSLASLLTEVAAVGTPVLYIDGIDRVEKEHQGVVADVVRTILTDPLLENWHIVISLRDAGSEPVRTWLPDLFEKGRLATVDVGTLDDAEAEALAKARPELAAVLFAQGAVQEIVRRPFFAKVLSRALAGSGANPALAPASEVDLIEIWWSRGGFNATGAGATARQRAIVELAAWRVRHLSQPLVLSGMSAPTITALDDLVADGVLQVVRLGHSVRFSHDIFFEWALYNRLVDLGDAWTEEVREAGEPPVIGRVVELLSQADFAADREWEVTLGKLEQSGMRSQWTRAWLLGPIAAASFDANRDRYYAICVKEDFRWLGKALVWFQAEKTIPNAAILDGRLASKHLKRHEIVRLADTFGWPSDLRAWGRLLRLVLDHADSIPVALVPDMVILFEVWENSLRGYPNATSSRLLRQAAAWLSQVERGRHSKRDFRRARAPSRWDGFESDLDDLEESLRSLVLRATDTKPDLVTTYLSELLADEYRLDQVFKGVAFHSSFLAKTHAVQLVDVSLLHFREELPQARADRQLAERREREERRRIARSKLESERTKEDELVLGGPPWFPRSHYGTFEWDDLAVDKGMGEYFPASPLREPFHALFDSAPDEGLRLVKGLSNHAMMAWRQLHRLDPERQGMPIPLELEFPWGKQQFWGAGREYLWARGLWGPKPLAGAYQAMESWALRQLEVGWSVDAVIEAIVRGNESIAAVGLAVAVLLKSQAVTKATLPLLTSQRLWRYDLERKVQEVSTGSSSMIGFFRPADLTHAEAVRALNALPFRQHWLRDYIPLILLAADETLAKHAREAMEAFGTNLPFEYEEQKAQPGFVKKLTEEARFNAEFAKPENVKTMPHPDNNSQHVIYIDNPLAREPEVQSRLAESVERQQEHFLWFWANKSLEGTELAAGIDPRQAIERAKTFDNAKLFEAVRRHDQHDPQMRRGAVAGVAAVVLKYRPQFQADDIRWAKDVTDRAAYLPEEADKMWTSSALIPWHPSMSAARALGFDIRAGEAGGAAKDELLRLVAHPLEGVALVALEVCFGLWDLDPKLGWCALWESLALCHISMVPMDAQASHYDPAYITAKRVPRVDKAIAHYRDAQAWQDLPAMPPAWIYEGGEAGLQDDEMGSDPDEDVVPPRWRRPDTEFDWSYGTKVLGAIPVNLLLGESLARGRFLSFALDALQWVINKMAPPWKQKGRRERSRDVGQFDNAIANLFAKSAPMLDMDELEQLFLKPVLALEDDLCYELLAPFVSLYVCAAIYDAPVMPANAIDVLCQCMNRVLKDPAFSPRSHRDGEIHGYRLPRIVRALLFVSVDNASGATRFANGVWTDIGAVLPIVDPLVRIAGFSASVMSDFLTLAERARGTYPVEPFADQVLAVLDSGRAGLKGWRGSSLPARIAGLVQSFAFRETPMALRIAQKLLRILDILVDMGDRRSAALQISDSFREVRFEATMIS